MKKSLIAFLLFICGICMCGCTKKKVLVVKVIQEQVEVGTTDIRNYLEVYMSNKPQNRITDYKIENYNASSLGRQVITVVYRSYEAVAIIEVVEKKITNLIASHSNYRLKTSATISDRNPLFKMTNAKLNAVRRRNIIAVYRDESHYETDQTGWEVAVNSYGQVEKVDVNVQMPRQGMILSVTGSRVDELKKIQIGDFVVWDNEIVYVYRDEEIAKTHTVFSLFQDVIDEFNYYPLQKQEEMAPKINRIISSLEVLYKEYDETRAQLAISQLNELKNKENEFTFEHNHIYSMTNITEYQRFTFSNSKEDIQNYQLFTTYTGKLYIGGFRNADTLVYYDKNCYITRNKYGYEVAIDKDGYVIQKDVLVELPAGGYILSGHSSTAAFLQNNIEINDRVEIINEKVHIYKNQKTFYTSTLINLRNQVIESVNMELENKIPHDYKYIHSIIEKMDGLIQHFRATPGNVYAHHLFTKTYLKIKDYSNIIYAQLLDNDIDKTRGMWYYPFVCFQGVYYYDDTSKEGIVHTLTTFKKMGINEILITPYIEGTYDGAPGYMVYESSIYEELPIIKYCDYGEYGHDYLECFISEAHKLGMSVTAYTQTTMGYMRALKEKNDAYYQIDWNGKRSKSASYDVYYYDICNDEVQALLLNWYKELFTNYDFDNVEYDLIRFPGGNLYTYLNVEVIPENATITDHGYTKVTMEKFMNEYHLSGDLKELIRTSKEVRSNWISWKREQLTEFVRKLSNMLRSIKPDIRISAAVYSDLNSALNSIQQDYPTWIKKGYIDAIEPMVYTSDLSSFYHSVKTLYENNEKYGVDIRIGIGAKITKEDIEVDLKEMKFMDSYGSYLLFCVYYYYRDQALNQLLISNHHYPFISSLHTKEERLDAYIIDTIDMIENFYSPLLNDDFSTLLACLHSKEINHILLEMNKLEDRHMKEYLYQRLIVFQN